MFFYDVSKLAKSERSVFNHKSKLKIQNLAKQPFFTLYKKYQMEIRNTVYVYSDIFAMVVDILRLNKNKFSKSQR